MELDSEIDSCAFVGAFDVEYVFDAGGYGDAQDVLVGFGQGA